MSMVVYKGVSQSSHFGEPLNDPLLNGFTAIHPDWSNDWPHQLSHILFVSESPYISCSQSVKVARTYAGIQGRIYRIRLQDSKAIPAARSLEMVRNHLGGLEDSKGVDALDKAIRKATRDSEVLVFGGIPKENIELHQTT